MKKEEILRKAQERKGQDEMEIQIIQRGSEIAMWTGLLFCAVIMIGKMLLDQPWQDIYSVYCSFIATLHFYKWYRLKKRSDMVYGLLWAFLTIMLAGAYFWNLMG